MTRGRKGYSREFKIDAVKLITEQGMPCTVAAESLGIHENTLLKWKKKFTDSPDNAFADKGKQLSLEEENRQLKRELAEKKKECEILKKAAAYFSRDQI